MKWGDKKLKKKYVENVKNLFQIQVNIFIEINGVRMGWKQNVRNV